MNPLSQLEFLIGSWTSPVTGQPGEGITGWSTFAYDLNQSIIVRKSRAEFAPQAGEKEGLVHDDLLIIYPQPGETSLKAIYFDNEGHVLHYSVTFPPRQSAVIFDSEGSAASPRARLVYEAAQDGSLTTEFFVAPPGGELISHVKGKLQRNAK